MYAYGTDPSSYYQYYYQQQQEYDAGQVSNASESQGNAFGDLDETAITRLTGKRKGRDSEVQFKTVNQQDILPSEEWRSHAQHIPAPKFVSKGATVSSIFIGE
ncbi:hypothetical protein BDB00DRAFT_842452 [Zychaea mexicana]|uniref:uncharacterized protein n=1 Tax=Zychaea mexicana TaxID=64656 RepID=UPI0022FF4309|nr:uncharacterized protein BDB00DRAFT_842452 [Zychaea mexicana]KAI9489549.1 hypothetical protein BDB00DRAFT_842452 [Zychaea mexicana]